MSNLASHSARQDSAAQGVLPAAVNSGAVFAESHLTRAPALDSEHRFAVAGRIVNRYLQYLAENNIQVPSVAFSEQDYRCFIDGQDAFDGVKRFLYENGILDYDAAPNGEEPNARNTIKAVGRFIPQQLNGRGKHEVEMALLFDMDGVLFFTPHCKCWKQVFDPFLAERGQSEFTEAEYHLLVSGKNPLEGTRDFFVARGIYGEETKRIATFDLPKVLPEIWEIREVKNRLVVDALTNEPIGRCQPSLDMLMEAHSVGIRTAVVSASKSTGLALHKTNTEQFVEVTVEGRLAAIENFPGKPDPAPFRTATEGLGIDPRHTVAVEDAVKGVASARRTGSFVIGLAQPEIAVELAKVGIDLRSELKAAGAHIVVDSLAELPLDKIIEYSLKHRANGR